MDAHKDRTALRLQLYANGFTPLANKMKLCLLHEWSTFKVDEARIQSKEWVRSGRFLDTGIRCGDVVAIDIDIDDPVLLNALLDEVINQKLADESLFVRVGRPPRELWVYRTKEKIGKRTTGHFAPKGAPEDHKGFAVEVLGAGCQFAAYGQRDETTAYAWPEESLLDHTYMDLPEITKVQADAIKDAAIAFFERNGLERRSPAGGIDKGYTHAYDLTPDMVFDVHNMGEMALPEIKAALRASPDGEVFRCKVEALRPTGGSWAGMISLVGGMVCLSDHGTYTSHFPEEADIQRHTAKLGRLLAERFPEPEPLTDLTMDPAEPLDQNLVVALQRYAYVENDGLVCDLAGNFMTHKMRAFHDAMAPFYEVKLGPKGGEVMSELSDLWRRSTRRITTATMQMRPDMPRPLFEEGGARHVNTYRPVDHSLAGGNAAIGTRMIANLLPVPAEREFFLQWLSYKLQHPEVPGPAVIMVARDSYGTGRGSLIALMTAIFGLDYVAPVDFPTLVGQGSQSQYNEWQSNSLMVVVDEAKEAVGGLNSWQIRNNAYEHLKSVVDPAARNLHIKRKGVKNTRERTYASIFIATNHGDAFIIPPNDRRIAVLENGQPMSAEYWGVFHAWMKNPANVAAFARELLAVNTSAYNPYLAPPMTAAKSEMVEAGTSELDRALAVALAGLVDTFVVKEQVLLKIEDYLSDNDAEVPDDWRRMVERMLLRKTRKAPTGVQERVRIDGKQRVVRLIGSVKAEDFQDAQRVIDTVLSNGPLTRTLKSSGQVVNFPVRR